MDKRMFQEILEDRKFNSEIIDLLNKMSKEYDNLGSAVLRLFYKSIEYFVISLESNGCPKDELLNILLGMFTLTMCFTHDFVNLVYEEDKGEKRR